MHIEITQHGRKGKPYRGTVNSVPFHSTGQFCRLVADLATPEDGCIEGIGRPVQSGYHQVAFATGKHYTQHAIIRALFEGMDHPPEGLHAAHGPCHNPRCVNPHHVSFKTAAENAQDRLRDGTSNHGERHPLSKLTDKQRDEVHALYQTGKYTQAKLARMYGVAHSVINKIVHRPTWTTRPMTADRAALIRFLAASGAYTGRQIAEVCETTLPQVANIKYGHSWKQS